MKMNFGASRDTRGEKVFYSVNTLLLVSFAVICLYPILCMISGSISDPVAAATGLVTFYPVGFSLRGFELVLKNKAIITGFLNSTFITVAGTALNVAVTLCAGFALSRREMIARGALGFYFAFTMWFSGGMVPSYLLVRSLGMMNTYWALIIPGAMSVWYMIICRTFLQSTIPEELFEAASIDGCSYFRYLTVIVVPLSKAIVAVLALWYAIGHWNAYFGTLLYVYDADKKPLSLVLRSFLVLQDSFTDLSELDIESENLGIVELMKNSLIMLACLPLWILYPFMQKFLVQGVMIGSVKG